MAMWSLRKKLCKGKKRQLKSVWLPQFNSNNLRKTPGRSTSARTPKPVEFSDAVSRTVEKASTNKTSSTFTRVSLKLELIVYLNDLFNCDHLTGIHTNLRPYECSFCGRDFIHYTDHKRHVMGHVSSNNFQCCIKMLTFYLNRLVNVLTSASFQTARVASSRNQSWQLMRNLIVASKLQIAAHWKVEKKKKLFIEINKKLNESYIRNESCWRRSETLIIRDIKS